MTYEGLEETIALNTVWVMDFKFSRFSSKSSDGDNLRKY